jgi:hypothetical protein
MEADSDEADQQVILEEEIDENYEPTDKGTAAVHPASSSCVTPALPNNGPRHHAEILEYAKWLGMDLEAEQVSKSAGGSSSAAQLFFAGRSVACRGFSGLSTLAGAAVDRA